MTWLETVGNVITAGALCTWALYDIHRRWNIPRQGIGIGDSTEHDRGGQQGISLVPGYQALQQGSNGWHTTTITFQDGGQQGILTLHDLLGPGGHFDPEHPQLVELLEHLDQGLAGGGQFLGNPALRRVARAGPQDFTEADYEMLLALDEGLRRRQRPVSEAQMSSLPTHVHTAQAKELQDASEEERSCSICLEAFKDREVVKTLPCLHHFHASCIEEWLRREGQAVCCPVCKTAVFEGQW